MKVSKRILVVCSVIAASLAAAGTLHSGTRNTPGVEEIPVGYDPGGVRQISTGHSPASTEGHSVASGRDPVVVRQISASQSAAAATDEDSAANAFDQITAQPARY